MIPLSIHCLNHLAQLLHGVLTEAGNLLICISEINFFSKLLVRNIIHSSVSKLHQIKKLLNTAVRVVTVYLGEEFAVKNKGKNNAMERIRNHVLWIFEKSHRLCRTNRDLAVTFQKSY